VSLTDDDAMIWESAPWKEQLVRDAGRIKRLARTKLSPDEENELAYVKLERLIFVTAYSMRKLWEAKKLSNSWNDQKLQCSKYPIKGKIPDSLNWHQIERHYDLDAGRPDSIRPEEFCDRIIHSFIFLLQETEEGVPYSVYFASDRTRKQGVWLIRLDDVADLVLRTGRDYPSEGHFVRGSDGQWITWAGHGQPPEGWVGNKARK
jgi:hypothetical protein